MYEFNYAAGFTDELTVNELDRIGKVVSIPGEDLAAYRGIFSFLDYTTLDGTDNQAKVKALCEKAIAFGEKGLPFPAAVCIYPPFIATAKKSLAGTPVKVATTAAAFPSGQMSLPVKLSEIDYAVGEGADEVDVVISRGTFLEGSFETIYHELSEMRHHCKDQTLKVILETGELQTPGNIARASEIAIMAGADFIKTSTGKINPAATPEAAFVMTEVIRRHFEKTGRRIGFKPAGGIAEANVALQYYRIVKNVLGEAWLSPALFRIGASRLAEKLSNILLQI